MQRGLRVLVVEEEFLISLDIHNTLTDAGVADVTTVRDVAQARALQPAPDYFDLAILEAKMGSADVVAFCDELKARGVPVVITSADRAVADLFPGTIALGKPFDGEALLAACRKARSDAFAAGPPSS